MVVIGSWVRRRPFGKTLATVTILTVTLISNLGAPGVEAATVLEREIHIQAQGETGYRIQERVRLRLDTGQDLARWARYPLVLDQEEEIVEVRAVVEDKNGKLMHTVRRRDHEEVDSVGFGLYNSNRAVLLTFEQLEVGRVLVVETTIDHKVPYPATRLGLAMGEKQESLRITVEAPRLRYSLEASPDSFRVRSEVDGRLELVAEGVEAFDLDADEYPPRLQVVWGSGGNDWPAIAQWAEDFMASSPREGENIAALAQRLTAGLASPREKVAALYAYASRQVRYEAVEIGEGGWRPSPAKETLERGWGDCKDKAHLLVGLAEAVDIPGELVLIRSGYGQGIDESLPSPFQFNHAIAAFDATAAGATAADPVVDGWLLLDPTVDSGGLSWLPPWIQNRGALLVNATGGRLLRSPARPDLEQRELAFDGVVEPDGTVAGRMTYTLSGSAAALWVRDAAAESKERTLEDLTRVLHAAAPGARIGQVGWEDRTDEVPRFLGEVTFRLDRAVRGAAGRRWLRPGALDALPDPRDLEGRLAPVDLALGTHRTVWRLQLLGDWCPPQPEDQLLETSLGTFQNHVGTTEDGRLVVRRELVLHHGQAPPEAFDALRQLTTAERRSGRGRVKLACGSGAA